MTKITYILSLLLLFTLGINAQVVVLDPGHGYGSSTSNNPDGRTATEIETALSVGLKTRTLIQNSCNWTVHMTRTTNINGWISVTQRAQMSNNWNADRFISIHCNAGGGTGTETFYCTHDDPTPAPDIAFSQKIQADMVSYGSWNNRRCVDDINYLNYHLGVLRYSSATACLNEIGFVDFSSDAAKLNSDSWRNNFAQAYFNALKSNLNQSCSASSAPGSFSMTLTPECEGTATRNRLNWTAAPNATGYDIYRNGTLYASNIAGTQYLNTLVTPGVAYSYYVRAKNSAGSVTNANGTQSATTLSCSATPGTFTLSATTTCSGSQSAINLTWTTSSNATSYDLYRNGNLYAQNLTGNAFLNTYLINAGSTYSFYMVAKNGNGTRTNSNGTISRTAVTCYSARTPNPENISELGATLYPNPSNGKFTVQLSEQPESNVSYTVYDVTGKLVQRREISADDASYGIEVDISAQASGVYIININAGDKEFSKKLIKN